MLTTADYADFIREIRAIRGSAYALRYTYGWPSHSVGIAQLAQNADSKCKTKHGFSNTYGHRKGDWRQ
jgi:hypothetical protein